MLIYQGLDTLQALTEQDSGNPVMLQQYSRDIMYKSVFRWNEENQLFEWAQLRPDWSVDHDTWRECKNGINWFIQTEFVEYPAIGLQVGDWAVDERNRVVKVTRISQEKSGGKQEFRVWGLWDGRCESSWGLERVRKANEDEVRNTEAKEEVTNIFKGYGRKPFDWTKDDIFTYKKDKFMVVSVDKQNNVMKARELFGSEGMIPRTFDCDRIGLFPMYFAENKIMLMRREDEGCQ